jgi:hypothetical protein
MIVVGRWNVGQYRGIRPLQTIILQLPNLNHPAE